MQVQVNTDNHIHGTDDLAGRVEAEVTDTLSRFGDRITRVEVHLHDLNGHKAGVDKRCLIEARVAGHSPVAVSHEAPTIEEAVTAAADKLERSLDHTLGRLTDHKGRTSFGGDQEI